jgi:hypothetical protein
VGVGGFHSISRSKLQTQIPPTSGVPEGGTSGRLGCCNTARSGSWLSTRCAGQCRRARARPTALPRRTGFWAGVYGREECLGPCGAGSKAMQHCHSVADRALGCPDHTGMRFAIHHHGASLLFPPDEPLRVTGPREPARPREAGPRPVVGGSRSRRMWSKLSGALLTSSMCHGAMISPVSVRHCGS